MDGLHLTHILFLAMWGGLVSGEMVMEILTRRRPEFEPAVRRFHFWIDLLVELPLLTGVLITGGLLLMGRPVDALLGTKIALALAAIAVNLYCAGVVIKRAAEGKSEEEAHRLSGRVIMSGVVGIPLGLAAFVLGLVHGGWLAFS